MVSLVCENCATPLPAGSRYCSACGTPAPVDGGSASGLANGGATDLRQALQLATAGEYEIHHELGRGGMGSVFLAREVGLDRLVAIKVLPPSLMWDGSLVERFKREARMVAKLHHPNIIPVYRVHHANNLVFYAMHYVPGRTLGEIMTPGHAISIPQVEQILLEAAAGLGYAHKRGVIHRDVKPANILLDGESHVHLTDFGIAKALAGSTQLTETGAVIGTPQYMAPEQCEGRMVDGRADQYSLAVVGYQLLAGHCPFESDSMKELLYHHLFTPPRPLDELRPETPAPLRDALHKALSKDPADRFDSMEDLRAAIEGKGPPIFVSWLDAPGGRAGEPVPSTPPRRRWDDAVTTRPLGERRRERIEPEQDPWDAGLLAGSVTSHHRQAMGALVVTAVTVAVVAALALASGARVSGSPPDVGAGLEQAVDAQTMAAAGPEVRDQTAAQTASREEVRAVEPREPESEPAGTMPAATGRLVVRGDMPADARLEIDGEPIEPALWSGGPIELAAGPKRVRVTAAGFNPFERDVQVEAGTDAVVTVSLERPAPTPPGPVARRDTRPRLPTSLVDELERMLAQGEVLRGIGRYYEAVETYEGILVRVDAARRTYRDGDVLIAVRTRADSLLRVARHACEIEVSVGNRRSCP